ITFITRDLADALECGRSEELVMESLE
ncbi:hypothetical protein Tco_0067743, partial [Tanacetum coccineum]